MHHLRHKLLIKECTGLLNDIHNKQPGVVNQWVAAATGKILVDKGLKLPSHLWPQQGHPRMMCFMSVVGVEHGE